MFVVTIGPPRGGREPGRVDSLITELNKAPLVRPFERTAGAEAQAITDSAHLVVALVLDLVRRGGWCIGLGIGDVDRPLPARTRDGRGRAFEAARSAIGSAKASAVPVAVVGPDAASTESAQTALVLTGLIVARRSAQGHAAVGLMDRGLSQAAAAEVLGISKQAVSQRLTAAAWQPEAAGRRLCDRLLREADR